MTGVITFRRLRLARHVAYVRHDKCMYGYGGDSAKDRLFADKDICGMIILEWIVRVKMGWCGVD
jgi:hypothetical protein